MLWQKQFMENATLLNALVNNAIDGIITIDDFGKVESINPSACKLFAYSEQEVVGKNIAMLIPSSPLAFHHFERNNITKNFNTNCFEKELIGRTKKGGQFPCKFDISEVNCSVKTIYAGFIHDLTQQKIDEQRLQNDATNLEALVAQRTKTLNDTIKSLVNSKEKVSERLKKEKNISQLKDRFLSMASHEFRTPLSTAYLSASLIEKYAENVTNANILKHAGKIVKAVANLTTVLNDFLYLEQLEIGKVKAIPICFDLVQLAEEIREEMQLLVKGSQKIYFKHFGDQRLINQDQNLIKNSIINLITNAIKYSDDHSLIEFTTEINDNQCIIKVKDEGIGIPIEDQQHLFKPFFRAHNTGNIPGTGLGLNIVARYIALMKGEISYSSSTKQGSLFTLTFSMP